MNNRKIIISIFLVASFVVGKPVFAEPSGEGIKINMIDLTTTSQSTYVTSTPNNITNENNTTPQPNMPTVYNEDLLFETETSIEKLDEQIENTMNEIDKQQAQIQAYESEIQKTQDEVNSISEDLQKKQVLMKDRLRALYINGNAGYLEVILDADNFSDLITRIDTVKRIAKFDKDTINEVSVKKETVDKKLSDLQKEQNKFQLLKKQNSEKLIELQSKKQTQQSIINKLNELKASMPKFDNANVNDAMNLINSWGSGTALIDNGNVTGEEIIKYTTQFLGTPYLWGGTAPGGFDCSGLVQYVYRHFGINLPRVTYDQVKVGQTVPRDPYLRTVKRIS